MLLLLFDCRAASNTSQFALSMTLYTPTSKYTKYSVNISSPPPPLDTTYRRSRTPPTLFSSSCPIFRSTSHSSPSSGSRSISSPRSSPRRSPYSSVHHFLPSIQVEREDLLHRNRHKVLMLPTEKVKTARLVATLGMPWYC